MMGKKIITRVVLPLIIIATGAGAARAIFAIAPEAAESVATDSTLQVEVTEARPSPVNARVVSTGIVIPAVEATITPEVSGRVYHVNPALIPGGRITEGDLLVRLDSRDYQLTREQEEAKVRSAELELTTERARGSVARREWDLLGGGDQPREESPLALRQPNLEASKANVQAARSGLARAKLNVSRTTIRAPWNSVVQTSYVQVGQVLSPGAKVVTLVGTDRIWVKVSVPLDRLPMIEVPGVNGETGSKARVIHELGPGQTVTREGRVIRLDSQLDAQTRTAQLLVEVASPFDEPQGAVPLLPGSYVNVEIQGRMIPLAYAVPRAAIYRGSQIWLVDGQERLEQREIQVSWGDEDQVFITSGLQPGDRIVTTRLGSPISGTVVHVQATGDAPPSPATPHASAPGADDQG
jgi:RND family efflux transporter MFP subunit